MTKLFSVFARAVPSCQDCRAHLYDTLADGVLHSIENQTSRVLDVLPSALQVFVGFVLTSLLAYPLSLDSVGTVSVAVVQPATKLVYTWRCRGFWTSFRAGSMDEVEGTCATLLEANAGL